MPVNGRPWQVKLWLYPGADPAAPPRDWGLEVDISDRIKFPGSLGGQPIAYSEGRSGEAGQVEASSMELSLANTDGMLSTHNPLGDLYGKLARNTPIRMGVVAGQDGFDRSATGGLGVSDSGHEWSLSTPADWSAGSGTAALTIPSANAGRTAGLSLAGGLDVDVTMVVTPVAVATGGAYGGGPTMRRSSSSSEARARLEFNTAGDVTMKIVRQHDGVTTELAVLNPAPGTAYTAGQRWKVRAQADGNELRMKAWPEAAAEPATWHLSAVDTELTGGGVGIYAVRFSGNTNAGTPTLQFDDYTVTAFEFTGTVPQWPVRWSKSGTYSWAPIRCAGILRRLQQGQRPLKSPLAQQLPAYAPTNYWPLEDGSDSTQLASGVTDGGYARFGNVNLAADNTLPGGGPTPTLTTDDGYIRGNARKLPAGHTGFSAIFFSKLANVPATKTRLASWTATGRVVRWVLSIDTNTVYVEGFDADGDLVTSASGARPVSFTAWVAWQLETVRSGANTTWALDVHQVGTSSYVFIGNTYASAVVSSATSFQLGYSTGLAGTSFAHVWLGANTVPFVTTTFLQVSSGYRGELASDRVTRVCAEAGIPVIVEPGDSQPMGSQRSGTALDVLRSCSEADYGLLYERGAALGFRPRSARYNQPVHMALSVAARHIDDAPEPVDDDLRLRNRWTITRDGGSSAVHEDALSIAREGLIDDAATINVNQDRVLRWHAAWRTYLGASTDLRWPAITLNLAHSTDLVPLWRARRYGFRLTVATGLPQVVGADPDVLVEGYSASLDPLDWRISLNCSSARLWDVGVAGTDRADSGSSTLAAGVTASATTLSVAVESGLLWTTDPAHFTPTGALKVEVGGEVMSVTDITGAASPQTFTVVRGVNGVTKSHDAEAEVHTHKPLRVAL